MKKVIVLVVACALALSFLVPSIVGAQVNWNEVNCCECQNPILCCTMQLHWYKVSHSIPGGWTVEYVVAHDSKAAAKSLGLRAGYNCFVTYPVAYNIAHPIDTRNYETP